MPCVTQALASRFDRAQCVELTGRQMLRTLLSGAVDVCAEPVWLTEEIDTPHLYPHVREDLCVVVKRRQHAPQTILRSFAADTWAATGASLAVFAGVLRLTGRRNVFLEVLDAFVNGGFAVRERDRRSNSLLLALSAFGLVLVNAFTGRFMSFLAVFGDVPQIDTLEEVARYATKVYGDHTLKRQLDYVDENDVIRKIVEKVEPSPEGLSLVVARREFSSASEEAGPAYVMSMEEARFLLEGRDMTDEATGAPLAHLVEQRALSLAHVAFMTRPRGPHRRRLETLLLYALEAGLPLKFKSDYWGIVRAAGILHRAPAIPRAASHAPSTDEPRALKPQALWEPSAYLGAGLLAAAVAFVVEVVQGWRTRRQQRPPLRKRRQRLRRRVAFVR